MPEQLIVITGAGASRDATAVQPFDGDFRPPLVTELFAERGTFTQILGVYPDAQSLAPDLRHASRTATGLGLETYLREHIVHSPNAYDRRRYVSIPLYLQHLFHEVSQHFTPHPVSYDRLVNAALRAADEVLFVTLNYDTLLDQRLAIHTPITSLDDYVTGHDEWSLIKLHGSVDWVREIQNPLERGAVHGLLQNLSTLVGGEPALSDEIQVIRRPGVEATRRPEQGVFNYPALSVPLGPEDELNCPPGHVAHLKARLATHDGLHILVIGYSGLDSALLSLLRESGNTLRSLFVVNHNADAAFSAAEHVAGALHQEADASMAAPEAFADFASGAALDEYFARLE